MSEDEVVIPALLRGARGSYGKVIRQKLAAIGCDDMPTNGPFVIGGMANHDAPAAVMLGGLGISRAAGYQLLDVLVIRGYLDRVAGPDQPGCLQICLTERGVAAGRAVKEAIAEVDAELARHISADELAGMRAGLMALAHLAELRGGSGATTSAG